MNKYNVNKYNVCKYNACKYNVSKYNVSKYNMSKYNVCKYNVCKCNVLCGVPGQQFYIFFLFFRITLFYTIEVSLIALLVRPSIQVTPKCLKM